MDPPPPSARLADGGFFAAAEAGRGTNCDVSGGAIGGLVKNLFTFFVDLFIVIFALFFMFRDGDESCVRQPFGAV